MKKRILALLLASSLVISAFVGCQASNTESSKDESSKESQGDSQEDSKEEEKKDPAVISMMYPDNASYPLQDSWMVIGLIEELANVELDLTLVPEADFSTKVETVFISGKMQDLILKLNPTPTTASSGVLLPVSKYEDQMPNFQAYIDQIGARESLDATRFGDGEYYSVPSKARTAQIQDKQWYIRGDIFEKNNIEVPTTMEGIYEAGLKLLEIYPDSVPLSNRYNILSNMAAAYGCVGGLPGTLGNGMAFDYETGKWAFEPATDAYKEYLTFANKMYSSGVLDQEFATVDSATYEQHVSQGDSFMFCDWVTNFPRYTDAGIANDPDFRLDLIYAPQGNEGHYGILPMGYWTQNILLAGSLADDEEHLAEVLAFADWGFTEEAEIAITWGKEGETFEYDDAGHIVKKDPSMDYSMADGLNNNGLLFRQHMDAIIYTSVAASDVAIFDQMAADKITPIPAPQSPLSTEELEDSQVYASAISEYVLTETDKFIYGPAEDIEANWDAYVAELENKGYKDLEALYSQYNK